MLKLIATALCLLCPRNATPRNPTSKKINTLELELGFLLQGVEEEEED
jgi:hypothetical protein